MPPGLSVNTTTGVISGSPTVGGAYKIYLIAKGSDASNIAILTLTLPTSAPVIALNDAGGVYATSASITGTVQYSGGADPTIILVWGETDEGTSDHEDWDDFATLGVKGVGPFNRTITGLSKSTPFFFRVKATNSGGTVWTPTKTFTTLENAVKPVLGNIMERLSDLFVDRPTVSIGVAARQLIIEGTATDPKHPVLADLAKRLHDHRIDDRGPQPDGQLRNRFLSSHGDGRPDVVRGQLVG